MRAVAGPRSRFKRYFQDLLEGGRPVSAPQLQKLRALWGEWVSERPRALPGEILLVEDPPSWEDVLERIEARLGFEPFAVPEQPGITQPGGRRLKPVMALDKAGELQVVIDRARENGHKLVITDLVQRFGINRDRVVQAIELRKRGHDLRETPPEFSAVSRSTEFAYWPTVPRPRKS